ncbi:YbfB/YjiJ family MFS transporter [Paenibacillus sp. N1-5-1-14]|uniref:YbfB/YjiJ family MFS transporter n=1 Tax=Paenibacillus radicibacter TaxID=2972488 RepID=UPI002159ACCC|nr:YbfB/YjiJ family MFS transporter [Paenibacillus radicibacter]MCR8644335.1 YbfB/YjiJ family MFS transporter [Paenibacillus radicibacter]
MEKSNFPFLIGGIFSLMIAMGIGRFAYTPILPLMQHDLSFSNAIAGYFATSNYAGYLFGAIITGIFPIKHSRTLALRMSLGGSILTTASMGFVDSYVLWYTLRFFSGVASAFVFVVASSIVLDKLAARGKTNLSGIFYGGVGAGILLTGLIIPKLSDLFAWEGAWIGLAGIAIVLVIFVWMWLKDDSAELEYKAIAAQPSAATTLTTKNRAFPWIIIAYGLEGLGYIVTGTFIVSIAAKTGAFGGQASMVWSIVGLAAIPSCFLWSVWGKKYGYVKLYIVAMLIQAVGIAIPAFWNTTVGLVMSALLFGSTFMGITTLTNTWARLKYPSSSGQIIGYLTTVYAAGQMLGPTIAGVIASFTEDYNVVLIGAAGAVFLGAMLLVKGYLVEKKQSIQITS